VPRQRRIFKSDRARLAGTRTAINRLTLRRHIPLRFHRSCGPDSTQSAPRRLRQITDGDIRGPYIWRTPMTYRGNVGVGCPEAWVHVRRQQSVWNSPCTFATRWIGSSNYLSDILSANSTLTYGEFTAQLLSELPYGFYQSEEKREFEDCRLSLLSGEYKACPARHDHSKEESPTFSLRRAYIYCRNKIISRKRVRLCASTHIA
jgi:hypothetical protein